MSEKRRMIDKIRALMEKTTANGCTEEEAMAAAQKVMDLMGAYGIDAQLVEYGSDSCEQGSHVLRERHDPLGWCAVPIGKCCCCRVWYHTDRQWVETQPADMFTGQRKGEERTIYQIVFFGLPHEVEVAAYLLSICRRVADTSPVELLANRKMQKTWHGGRTTPLTRAEGRDIAIKRDKVSRHDIESYRAGVCESMALTLDKMAKERQQKDGQKYEDRMAWVNEAMEAAGIRLGTGRGSHRSYDARAMNAGREKGKGVRFNPGMAGRSTKMIGRG